MPSRVYFTIQLALATLFWFVLLVARDVEVTLAHLWPFGTVLALLVGANLLFDRVLWRWAPVARFVPRPLIHGTWQVALQSDWPRDSGEARQTITGFMAIEQTFGRLEMRLMTPEGRSDSISYAIERSGVGGYLVTALYRNEPRLELQKSRSPVHYGALKADVPRKAGEPPEAFSGTYWTDRNTTGSMRLSGRKREVHGSYEAALDASEKDADGEGGGSEP